MAPLPEDGTPGARRRPSSQSSGSDTDTSDDGSEGSPGESSDDESDNSPAGGSEDPSDDTPDDPADQADDEPKDNGQEDAEDPADDVGQDPDDSQNDPADEPQGDENGQTEDPGDEPKDEGDGQDQTGDDPAGADTSSGDKVGMFLAVGFHGRSIISCDEGRTWIENQERGPAGESDNWHRWYTPKGLTYGDGMFIFLTGWGKNGTANVTRNGVDWERINVDNKDYYGGVGYMGDRFVAIGGGHVKESKDRGMSRSKAEGGPGGNNLRTAAAYPGIMIGGKDTNLKMRVGGGNWRGFSCSGYDTGGIGHEGGFAGGNGMVMLVTPGSRWCSYKTSNGDKIADGNFGKKTAARPTYSEKAKRFWVGNRRLRKVYTTKDGRNWDTKDSGEAEIELVAESDAGNLVGISGGNKFYYSTDEGGSWQRAQAPGGADIHRPVRQSRRLGQMPGQLTGPFARAPPQTPNRGPTKNRMGTGSGHRFWAPTAPQSCGPGQTARVTGVTAGFGAHVTLVTRPPGSSSRVTPWARPGVPSMHPKRRCPV